MAEEEARIAAKLAEMASDEFREYRTILSTAITILGNTPVAEYFSHTLTNLAFHDLTEDKSLPRHCKQLLGLGNKFIATPPYTTSAKDLHSYLFRFKRDLSLKVHFSTKSDDDDDDRDSKLYLKSKWVPDSTPSEVEVRIERFFNEISNKFCRRKANLNLRLCERKLLMDIKADDSVVIALSDKGLGPCAVKLTRYISDALVHLEDNTTYVILSEDEARREVRKLQVEIIAWLDKFKPRADGEKEVRPGAGSVRYKAALYIRQKTLEAIMSDPYAYFYLLYKLHKSPIKTRPVSSQCASVSFAIGQFVDEQLQQIAKTMASYFQDSFALKRLLTDITLPPGTSLYSMDAVSMYTSIDSAACLMVLSDYLRRPDVQSKFEYNADCLIEALGIVLRSNIMKFGDIYVKQISGVAMGVAPAPPIATLYFAVHEDFLLEKWKDNFFFYKRFIDDVFCIWKHETCPLQDDLKWKEMQADVNNFHGLKWEFTTRGTSLNFMDMVIYKDGNKLSTDLFEKPMALFLYIPPFSAHPPGVLASLVMGQILRIFTLCSEEDQKKKHLLNFFHRLINRGHVREQLLPLFEKAVTNAESYLKRSDEEKAKKKQAAKATSDSRLFLHVPYHPDNPPASELQALFRDCISNPPGEPSLQELKNLDGNLIQVNQMTVCYHRHLNLGNVLSYRKIDNRKGPKVSDLLTAGRGDE